MFNIKRSLIIGLDQLNLNTKEYIYLYCKIKLKKNPVSF